MRCLIQLWNVLGMHRGWFVITRDCLKGFHLSRASHKCHNKLSIDRQIVRLPTRLRSPFLRFPTVSPKLFRKWFGFSLMIRKIALGRIGRCNQGLKRQLTRRNISLRFLQLADRDWWIKVKSGPAGSIIRLSWCVAKISNSCSKTLTLIFKTNRNFVAKLCDFFYFTTFMFSHFLQRLSIDKCMTHTPSQL